MLGLSRREVKICNFGQQLTAESFFGSSSMQGHNLEPPLSRLTGDDLFQNHDCTSSSRSLSIPNDISTNSLTLSRSPGRKALTFRISALYPKFPPLQRLLGRVPRQTSDQDA